jgi:hypothetical protein
MRTVLIELRCAAWRALVVLWSGAAAFALALLLYAWGPAIERRVWPVISDLRVEIVATAGNAVTVRPTFVKARACAYLSTAWYVGDPGRWYERAGLSIEGATGDTRPRGRHRGSRWTVTFPEGYETDPHFVVFRHQCHPFWQTETVIPFPSWFGGEP